MKVSVSLPNEVILYLDDFAHRQGYESRSAVLNHAVRLLRESELGDAYEDAWDDWANGDDAALWSTTVGDGLAH